MQSKSTAVPVSCAFCARPFAIPRWRIRESAAFYCNNRCRAEAQKAVATARLPARFWARVGRGDGCWAWQGPLRHDGYGTLVVHGQTMKAHRMAYALTFGPIPAGLHVCHRCDVPACCNPAHLFLARHADNMADMQAKGRAARGERTGPRLHPEAMPRGTAHWTRRTPERVARGEQSGTARLTEAIVLDIRARFARGERQSDLAREFSVSRPTLHQIVHRQSWKHL